jgi:hypothetical protein
VDPKAVTVYRLDASGNRLDKVTATVEEKVIQIECQVAVEGKPAAFYYEVLIDDPKPAAPPSAKAKTPTKSRPRK